MKKELDQGTKNGYGELKVGSREEVTSEEEGGYGENLTGTNHEKKKTMIG
jgi:hypothetical protein